MGARHCICGGPQKSISLPPFPHCMQNIGFLLSALRSYLVKVLTINRPESRQL